MYLIIIIIIINSIGIKYCEILYMYRCIALEYIPNYNYKLSCAFELLLLLLYSVYRKK